MKKNTRRKKVRAALAPPDYKTIVFAGGGSRCLWQVGFMDTVLPALRHKPAEITCVSAGAAMACLIYSGNKERSLELFKSMTAANGKNFYPERILSRQRAFPHYEMYRKIMLDSVDARGLANIHKGPLLRVLLTRPPFWAGPRLATFAGISAYYMERRISYPVHPRLTRKMAFKAEVVSVLECKSPEELADLILASSCTPPFTPILSWKGKTALDGGFIDNVPADFSLDQSSPMLILLTRRYDPRSIPAIPNRTYVQPSRDITITKWDYTNPAGLDEAYRLGVGDGESFLARMAP